MASTIQIKRGTGSAVPTGLSDGELAINLDSGKLYFGSGSTSVDNFTFGELTAEKYIVSSSVLYVTTSFSSGSTEFGDTADDTHTFTGNITASGDISASGIGTFNRLDVAEYIYHEDDNTYIRFLPDRIITVAGGNIVLDLRPGTSVNFGHTSEPTIIQGSTLTLTGDVTASGNISSSGTIVGSNLSGTNTGDQDLSSYSTIVHLNTSSSALQSNIDAKASITQLNASSSALQTNIDAKSPIANPSFTGNITASGNISSSGTIVGSNLIANSASFSTRVTLNDAKVTNSDQSKADINALDITEVGTISSGVWQGTTIKTAYIGDDQITEDKLANTLLAEIDANTAKTSNIVQTTITGNAGSATDGLVAQDIPTDGAFLIADDGRAMVDSVLSQAGTVVSSTGHISSSTNIYAADYFDNGTNISSIYSPIAGGSGIVTVGTIGTGVWQGTTIKTAYIGDDQVTEAKLANTLLAEIDANTDKVTNVATNLSITTSTTTATVASSDGTDAIIPVATTSVGGVMSKAIFDEHTANVAKNTNVSTNLTATTHASQITINSSDGDNVVIAEASDTIAGLMTTTHHDKLDGIEASATADQTQADINGLAITTVGTIGTGVWNGTVITSAKLDADTAHLSGAQSFTGLKTFSAGIAPSYIKHTISGNNAGDYGPGAEILFGISAETTTAGAIYTLRSGVWTLIDANTDNRVDRLCAVAVGTNSSTNGMLIRGCVTLASAFTAGTDVEGVQVYASETGGQATITAPSDSGDLVRILGYSLNVSAKKMFFNPDSTFLEIA